MLIKFSVACIGPNRNRYDVALRLSNSYIVALRHPYHGHKEKVKRMNQNGPYVNSAFHTPCLLAAEMVNKCPMPFGDKPPL